MLLQQLLRLAGRGLAAFTILLLFGAFNRLEAYDCCQPPADVDYACDKLPYGFDPYDKAALQSLFGEPTVKCSNYWWKELTPKVDLNNCQIGTITRKFELTSGYGVKQFCSQTVTITGAHDYLIYFPKDAIAACRLPDAGPLVKRENGCDLLTVSKKDEQFGTGSSGCYKILRTYRVINWCEYDGESPAVKIGRDEDCDDTPGDEGVWLIRRRNGKVYLDRDDDIYNISPRGSANPCTGKEGYWKSSDDEPRLISNGFWEYTQHLKVYDDVQPKISFAARDPFCSVNNDCKGPVELNFTVEETCSADAVTVKVFLLPGGQAVPLTDGNNIAGQALSGAYPNYKLSGRFPLGNHLFEVHVKDGCGNTGIAKIPFSVVDCKAPTPICYHGISMTLLPTEPGTDADGDGDTDPFANVVWVSDLLRSQTSDCSAPIKYSINRAGETPDPARDHLVLTCEDADTVRVQVYAWDTANNPYAVQPDGSLGGPNYDRCETYIAIRKGSCPLPAVPAQIAGKVKTFTGMALDQVEIRVSGGMEMMQMTDDQGAYLLQVMSEQHYYLRPYKEDDFMRAVNTRDIIALSYHLNGRRPLSTPYQLIAADVNNSGSVTVMDLVYLRKAVLGQIESFPNSPAWRFVPASHIFADPLNPWKEPLPEFDFVDHMTTHMRWANFYAIKVGDIDNSVSGDNARRVTDPVYLNIADLYLEAGQTYSAPVALATASDLAGFQFELFLDTDGLVVEEVESGLLPQSFWSADRLAGEGTMAVSWNSFNGETGPGEGALFSLRVRARRAGYLHEMLNLQQRRIAAEGYDAEGNVREVRLQFAAPFANTGLELDQNYPNPFRDLTRIRFYVAGEGPVRLQVFDLTGRLLYAHQGLYGAGEQTLTLRRADLKQAGLLIYTLEAGGRRLSRKMVLTP